MYYSYDRSGEEEYIKEAQHNDISIWFYINNIKCPYCGLEWKTAPPEHNLSSHWHGDCMKRLSK